MIFIFLKPCNLKNFFSKKILLTFQFNIIAFIPRVKVYFLKMIIYLLGILKGKKIYFDISKEKSCEFLF